MTMMLRTPPSRRVQWGVGESRQLLSSNDITYLGQYTVPNTIAQGSGGGVLADGRAFTLRYVSSSLRFLTFGYDSGAYRLVEFTAPGNLGDTVSTLNTVWSDITIANDLHGIAWDEDNGVLWETSGWDYPDDEYEPSKAISTRVLNSNGTISSYKGRIGLQGITARRMTGGMVKIPAWFQSQYSVPAYAVGFGGYCSRMSVGPVSLGLSLYAIPSLNGYSNNTDIPSNTYKVLADHQTGATVDDTGYPTTKDRGIRFNTNFTNEYDFGAWNGTPDGYRRCTWADTWGGAVWIDNDAGTRTKHGFIALAMLATGRTWYENSTLNQESTAHELQVFDPLHLAQCAAGSRNPWNVQPVSGLDLEINGGGFAGHFYGGTPMAFDSTTNRLYVYLRNYGASNASLIKVYSVGGA